MSWTTPAELAAQVQRLWDTGAILASMAGGPPLFPRRLGLKTPASADLTDRFDEVRRWISQLLVPSSFRIETRELQHRVIGSNTIPKEAWIDSIEAALQLIDKEQEAKCFRGLVDMTTQRLPQVLPLLARRPLRALELSQSWSQLLEVVLWVQQHPKPDIYLRQVDIPGVHSKFFETHVGVLSEMLELLQPDELEPAEAFGVSRFCRRHGFREKPRRVRFRILDPALALLPGHPDQDITLDQRTFAGLATPVRQVFITENEINFLAFPSRQGSMIVFGAGYGFDNLVAAQWLLACAVHYWGDIDTHGFAILDQLRECLPHAQSFLMNRLTLMRHRSHWVGESKPELRDLHRLTTEERALFDDLRDNKLGNAVRLEQERIAFGCVVDALNQQQADIRG